MATARLTKRVVDELGPKNHTYFVYDEDLAGFGVRVGTTGAKSYVIEYRPGAGGRSAPKKRVTLGSAGKMTCDQARKAAKTELARVRLGSDPAAERKAERVALSLSALLDAYLTEEVEPKKAKGTAALYRLYFEKHVKPVLGSRRAHEITRDDVAKLHTAIGEEKQVTANRVVRALSGAFSFGIRRGRITMAINPAVGIELFGETSRDRYLTTEEFQRLGEALREAETTGLPWALKEDAQVKHRAAEENQREIISASVTGAIRLLIYTGCRLREILHLRWEDVDLERGLLFLPTSKTGKKTVVLNDAAMAEIRAVPRTSIYVIAGQGSKKPRSDLKRPWSRIAARAKLDGVRVHDLRHSFASVGAGASLGLPIIGKLLGHTQASTTQRYAHLDADPLKRAADVIGWKIADALGERSKQNNQAEGDENV